MDSSLPTQTPDWQREALTQWWQPSRQLLKALRSYQKWQKQGGMWGKAICALRVIEFRFWTVVCGCDIPLDAQIGGGFMLPHPTGVVIHPDAKIGINCIVFQQVTIVANVTIGNHVFIGAGAKILKQTAIEDYGKVGANAVVKNMTIPAHRTAVGIPAQLLPEAGQAE